MAKITTAQNRALHQLLNQLGLMDNKALIILNLTQQRTGSSKELSVDEANTLLKSLGDELDQRTGPTRRKILHLMALLGYVRQDGTIDYPAIDNWVRTKTGEANPRKVGLKALDIQEINRVCTIVEAWYKNTLKAK